MVNAKPGSSHWAGWVDSFASLWEGRFISRPGQLQLCLLPFLLQTGELWSASYTAGHLTLSKLSWPSKVTSSAISSVTFFSGLGSPGRLSLQQKVWLHQNLKCSLYLNVKFKCNLNILKYFAENRWKVWNIFWELRKKVVPKLKTCEIILIHPRFGRRKSWLVPAQLCIGCLVCSSLSASLYKYNIHPVHCRCYIIAMYLINNDSIATFTTKSSWDFYVCLKLSSSLDHEPGKKLSVRFAHWLYLFSL